MQSKKLPTELNIMDPKSVKTIRASSPQSPQPTLFPTDPKPEATTPERETPPTPLSVGAFPVKKPASAIVVTPSGKPAKTRVIVKFDVGFNNHLTIRGKGANLSWDKGIPLVNVKRDEWIWETETPFANCEFKVLINDNAYEVGENHSIKCGASFQYTPIF